MRSPGKSWICCHLNLVSTGWFVEFFNSLMNLLISKLISNQILIINSINL